MDSGTRKYRMTPEGEKPIWASRRTLEKMAQEDARTDWSRRNLPRGKIGNLVYDQAYDAAYSELERSDGEAHPQYGDYEHDVRDNLTKD